MQQTPMAKWEYKVLDAGRYFRDWNINCEALEKELNALGSKGWETMGVGGAGAGSNGGDRFIYSTIILKRQIV